MHIVLQLLSSNISKHSVTLGTLKYKESCGKRNSTTHFTRNLHRIAERHARALAHTHKHTHMGARKSLRKMGKEAGFQERWSTCFGLSCKRRSKS